MSRVLFTSESVSEGHPDKICDQISDAILDACLEQDSESHCAIETFITENYVLIGGEIKSLAKVNYEAIARKVLIDIGYKDDNIGIDGNNCIIDIKIKEQSENIYSAVDQKDKIGAGDQGIVFGYATDETKNYMPLAFSIANSLILNATLLRKINKFKFARPDMKSQVTIDYTDVKKPRIDTILMSVQHDEFNCCHDKLNFIDFIKEKIIKMTARLYNFNIDFNILINPSGKFVIGGPKGDTGLTGRKIIVDTYGGYARNGGGAFSGKDATKIDRSASYMARKVAKHIVALNWAKKCEIQLSYAIGLEEPVSINIETFGTEAYPKDIILKCILLVFKFDVKNIIDLLDLKMPVFKRTAVYGHFGWKDYSWEKLDYLEELKNAFKNIVLKLKN